MFKRKENAVVKKKTKSHSDPRVAAVEKESGLSFKDVKIHYASSEPKKIGALAFAYGNDVHLGPGQEKHLNHELGHVVQQRQGIVKPTMMLKGFPVNDESELEKGADRIIRHENSTSQNITSKVVQRLIGFEFQMLNSKARLTNNQDSYAKLFKTTLDGDNIEMISPALNNKNDVTKVIGGMSNKAEKIHNAKTKRLQGIENIEFMDKDATDGSAQPQINVDIDFTQAINLDLIYTRAKNSKLFDVKAFHWKPTNSNITIQKSIELAGIIKNVASSMNINDNLKEMIQNNDKSKSKKHVDIDYTMAAHNIVGLAQLIASQFFQSKIEKEQYQNDSLDKDIPVLIKTSFKQSIESLSHNFHISIFVINQVLNYLIISALKDSNIKVSDYDYDASINDSTHLYLNPEFSKEALSPKVNEKRHIAIAEFRRAPIIHYVEWVNFACNAFNIFSTYENLNEQLDESQQKSSKSITPKKKGHR